MFGYSERQEQLSIDNAFHVQVVIHLESLDRNCGRLTKKPVQLPVIVMALAQRALREASIDLRSPTSKNCTQYTKRVWRQVAPGQKSSNGSRHTRSAVMIPIDVLKEPVRLPNATCSQLLLKTRSLTVKSPVES
jgi:hypothetical protein